MNFKCTRQDPFAAAGSAGKSGPNSNPDPSSHEPALDVNGTVASVAPLGNGVPAGDSFLDTLGDFDFGELSFGNNVAPTITAAPADPAPLSSSDVVSPPEDVDIAGQVETPPEQVDMVEQVELVETPTHDMGMGGVSIDTAPALDINIDDSLFASFPPIGASIAAPSAERDASGQTPAVTPQQSHINSHTASEPEQYVPATQAAQTPPALLATSSSGAYDPFAADISFDMAPLNFGSESRAAATPAHPG